MGTTDLWIRDNVTYLGFVCVGSFVAFCIGIWLWNRFRENTFRSYLLGFETECAALASIWKEQLFQPLKKMESNDEILRSIGCIRVLEIGVKTGENIQFYPAGTHLIGIDWNKKLGEYLLGSDRAWQFSHVYLERLMIGDGSSMKDIPSGCVDVVVTTRSLCSTASVRDTLREIWRVLAPDGKYLFLEHVPDVEGSFAQRLQKILTKTNIWPTLFGNCHLDSDPIKEIRSAGFKSLDWKSFTLEGYVSQPNHLFLTRHHVYGTATR